jgi:D-glycerate 3-kinase
LNEATDAPATLAPLSETEGLPRGALGDTHTAYKTLAEDIAVLVKTTGQGQIIGLCGAQGSGKTTVAAIIRVLLEARGLRAAVVSIDDLYLSRAERQERARKVHPLLATRGPPGTHDIALGHQLFDSLFSLRETQIPRFDKATDDRRPRETWETFRGAADVVLLEGWCVGAKAQSQAQLLDPINDLERYDDADGVWRRCANAALAEDYQTLFDRLDRLVLLKAPNFEIVEAWRWEQEEKLRSDLENSATPNRAMTRNEIVRFVQHYERITRHILSEMPNRGDVVVELDDKRGVNVVRGSLVASL